MGKQEHVQVEAGKLTPCSKPNCTKPYEGKVIRCNKGCASNYVHLNCKNPNASINEKVCLYPCRECKEKQDAKRKTELKMQGSSNEYRDRFDAKAEAIKKATAKQIRRVVDSDSEEDDKELEEIMNVKGLKGPSFESPIAKIEQPPPPTISPIYEHDTESSSGGSSSKRLKVTLSTDPIEEYKSWSNHTWFTVFHQHGFDDVCSYFSSHINNRDMYRYFIGCPDEFKLRVDVFRKCFNWPVFKKCMFESLIGKISNGISSPKESPDSSFATNTYLLFEPTIRRTEEEWRKWEKVNGHAGFVGSGLHQCLDNIRDCSLETESILREVTPNALKCMLDLASGV